MIFQKILYMFRFSYWISHSVAAVFKFVDVFHVHRTRSLYCWPWPFHRGPWGGRRGRQLPTTPHPAGVRTWFGRREVSGLSAGQPISFLVLPPAFCGSPGAARRRGWKCRCGGAVGAISGGVFTPSSTPTETSAGNGSVDLDYYVFHL